MEAFGHLKYDGSGVLGILYLENSLKIILMFDAGDHSWSDYC